jgi:hypothetical protein
VRFINELVGNLVDEEKEVVLLAHSSGGKSAGVLSLNSGSRFPEMDSEKLEYGYWLMLERDFICPASEGLRGVTKKEREQQAKRAT